VVKVGSERWITVRGGGPSLGGARGGRLGAARPAVAGADVRGAAAWWCGRARRGEMELGFSLQR
jgi:hypothetical protein